MFIYCYLTYQQGHKKIINIILQKNCGNQKKTGEYLWKIREKAVKKLWKTEENCEKSEENYLKIFGK